MRPQISHRPLLTRGVAPMLTFGGQNVDCNPAGRKPSKRDLGVQYAAPVKCLKYNENGAILHKFS